MKPYGFKRKPIWEASDLEAPKSSVQDSYKYPSRTGKSEDLHNSMRNSESKRRLRTKLKKYEREQGKKLVKKLVWEDYSNYMTYIWGDEVDDYTKEQWKLDFEEYENLKNTNISLDDFIFTKSYYPNEL